MNIVGAVTLRRKVQLNPIWRLPPHVLKFFVWCLIEANWREESWYDGYQEVVIPRGSFVSTFREMAIACNLTVKEVRVASEHLVKLGIISFRAHNRAQQKAHVATVVTILNYNSLQAMGGDLRHTSGHSYGTATAQLRHSPGEKTEPVQPNLLEEHKTRGSPERPLKEEEVKKKRSLSVGARPVTDRQAGSERAEVERLLKREGQRIREPVSVRIVAEVLAALGDAPISYLEDQVRRRRQSLKSLGLVAHLAADARAVWAGEQEERARRDGEAEAQKQKSADDLRRMVEERKAVLADPAATEERKQWAREDLETLLNKAG